MPGRRGHGARQFRYQFVDAPESLSLIENAEAVSRFLDTLRKHFAKRHSVFVRLRHVTRIDYSGLLVLLSVMVRFKAKRIRFNGDRPIDLRARHLLEESHFFDHLLNAKFREKDNYALTESSSIFTHAKRAVDSELGARIIAAASSTVWGESRRCPGIQRAFIELMQNTHDHASFEKAGDRHWWLSVKHFGESRRVAFCFLDYGIGVFNSLGRKRVGDPLHGVLDRLYALVRYGDNASVLKLILEGEIHRTVSGKYYRGKGLPGIYQALKRGDFARLVMITNQVMYDSADDSFVKLANEFNGTFLYWELNDSNRSLPHANHNRN